MVQRRKVKLGKGAESRKGDATVPDWLLSTDSAGERSEGGLGGGEGGSRGCPVGALQNRLDLAGQPTPALPAFPLGCLLHLLTGFP